MYAFCLNCDHTIRMIIINLSLFCLQELKESFNYGLFCPPSNGRAGKFLDEERRLGDYPFNGPVGYLEVRQMYKLLLIFSLKSTTFTNICTCEILHRTRDKA